MAARILGIILLVIGFSFMGGAFHPRPSYHNYKPDHTPTQNPRILARHEQHIIEGDRSDAHIATSAIYPDVLEYFYSSQGRSMMDIGVFNHHPVQDFYHPNGKLAVQMGTYNDDVRANEEGLPIAGLSDEQGNLRLLFRLDGSDESPLIIMKDTHGRNRIIFGLDINGGEYEPFLVNYDNNASKSVFFGNPASPGNPN